MRKVFAILLILFMAAGLAAQQKEYDWSNLSAEDIAEIREMRHAFYKLEAEGHQEAIVEELLNSNLKLNGNQADFDVHYYGIHLDLNFGTESIAAQLECVIEALVDGFDAIDLNLRNELTVDSVIVAGQSAAFSHVNHLLAITTPSSYDTGEDVSFSVYYHGQPYYDGSAGMDFTTLTGGSAACWTKATPYRARYWWPCKDFPVDKADSLDLYIEMPDDYDLAINGILISSTPQGAGRKLEHWQHRYPINTYNVAFCCTDYDIDIQTWNYDSYSMPVYSLAVPGNPEAFTAFKTLGPPVLTILSDIYGIYPFVEEKFGNADFGWYGAMEHQTCCMYATDFHPEYIIAHETAHQWWGDMITCRTFNHIWLNEGFASYSEALHREAMSGEAAYHNYMQTQKYLGEGSIYVENLVYEEIYYGPLSYDKASWVLHMLRGVVGDSLFFQTLRNYSDSEFKYGTATTEDFSDITSITVGEDMSWYFQQWIYGEGNPEYDISWECFPDTERDGYELALVVEQVQDYGTYFKMPVRTTFVTSGGDLDTLIWNEGQLAIYSLSFADSVLSVQFDPQQWILRKVDYVPFAMHIATTSLSEATLGVPYSQTLEVIGGIGPYTWTFMGGDLPFGTTFDPETATISGTPTWPASYFFNIRVRDSQDPFLEDIRDYRIDVVEGVMCGDADGNNIVNISDAVFLITYIFGGGPPPDPMAAGDVDCSGIVNISDVVYLISYIFGGGPAPCANCP